MLLLVASLIVGHAAISDPQLAAKATSAWTKVQPSIVIVSRRGAPRGTAALIDSQGYFITGNSVVGDGQGLEGQFFDGMRVTLFLVTVDGPTQLALLKTYDPMGDRQPVSLYAPGDETVNADHPKTLIAALPGGPISAELVNIKTLALLSPAHSVAMLSEIHFELAQSKVAGDPVFSLDGLLVGILQATLADKTRVSTSTNIMQSASGSSVFGGGGGRAAPMLPRGAVARPYGPGTMTIAYSPGPQTMQRVIGGFLSPNHAVQRPAIGVFCRDAVGAGALIDRVVDNSPAAAAGLKEGDVIINIEGSPIQRQLDFAVTMLQQTVGSEITVTVRRQSRLIPFHVKVGM